MSYEVGHKIVWIPEPEQRHGLYNIGEHVSFNAKKIVVTYA